MAAKITLVAILIFSMVIPFLGYVLGNRKEKSFKASLAVNLVLFSEQLWWQICCFSAGISMQHPIPRHPQQRDGDTWRQHCQPDFPVSVPV